MPHIYILENKLCLHHGGRIVFNNIWWDTMYRRMRLPSTVHIRVFWTTSRRFSPWNPPSITDVTSNSNSESRRTVAVESWQITYWQNTVSQKSKAEAKTWVGLVCNTQLHHSPPNTHKTSAANCSVSYQLYKFFQILDTKILKLPQVSLTHNMFNIP